VRAFARGGRRFSAAESADNDIDTLVTDGQDWAVTEDALVAADGTQLPRAAGHVAY
jgi:hypothetical protein